MKRPALALLLAGVLLAGGADLRGEEERPFDCPLRALLLEEDPALRRAYDGIRKGLEQAQLPRVCLELPGPGEDPEAVLAALEATPPPLLFVLGGVTAERLGARMSAVPRVFVDTAWLVNDAPFPSPPDVRPPAAIVRGIVSAAQVAETLRGLGLGPEPPDARLAWEEEGSPEDLERRLGQAAGFRPWHPGDGGTPAAILRLALHAGERPLSFATSLALAEEGRAVLVSDDLADWGRGAAVVLAPDAYLLGRVAADHARRLLDGEAGRVLRATVGAFEVHVDLGAAARQGCDVPLRLLARADQLRRGPPAVPEGR